MVVRQIMLITTLAIIPVVANANKCIDFDENMNVIEYDCEQGVASATKREISTSKVRNSNFIFTMKLGAGKASVSATSPSEFMDFYTNEPPVFMLGAGIRYQLPTSKWFIDTDLNAQIMLWPNVEVRDFVYIGPDVYVYGITDTDGSHFDVFATGSLGYKLSPRFNVYGLAGLGYIHANMEFLDITFSELGYRVGAGIEFNLFRSMNLFGELTHSGSVSDLALSMQTIMLGAKFLF